MSIQPLPSPRNGGPRSPRTPTSIAHRGSRLEAPRAQFHLKGRPALRRRNVVIVEDAAATGRYRGESKVSALTGAASAQEARTPNGDDAGPRIPIPTGPSAASIGKYRPAVEEEEIDDQDAKVQDLREAINTQLANVGLVSAFMCALASASYSNAPEITAKSCYQDPASLDALFTLQWFAMGFFFLTISFTILLAADTTGLPNDLLLAHLRKTAWLHDAVTLTCACGLFLMASGYGIDLDQRVGCGGSPVGIGTVMAPGFPFMVCGINVFLRAKRRQTSEGTHGSAWVTTWRDCIAAG